MERSIQIRSIYGLAVLLKKEGWTKKVKWNLGNLKVLLSSLLESTTSRTGQSWSARFTEEQRYPNGYWYMLQVLWQPPVSSQRKGMFVPSPREKSRPLQWCYSSLCQLFCLHKPQNPCVGLLRLTQARDVVVRVAPSPTPIQKAIPRPFSSVDPRSQNSP